MTITGEIAPVTVNVYTNGAVIVNAFTVAGAIYPAIVNVYINGSVYTNGCYKALHWLFQGGSFCYLYFFVMPSCLVIAASCAAAGKWLTSWLAWMWCSLVLMFPSHVMSWVSGGNWLCRFLIFAFLLTFINLYV